MITKFLLFARLIRTGNLLILFLTQVFARYFLNPSATFSHLIQPEFLYLSLSTVLAAGAGYIINDYMDVKLDLVNKPGEVIVGNGISRRWAMLLHFFMNLIAISLAWKLGNGIALAVFCCVIALWIYSQALKKTYLTGNLLVATLTSSTLWILFLFDESMMPAGVWVYSLFAFLCTLIREIIKDTEDLRGDQEFKCKTLPIVLGLPRTREVLFWLQFVLLMCTAAFINFFPALSMSSNKVFLIFMGYVLAFVIFPMAIQAWLIRTADVKKDFTRLSFLSKLIMLSGILSMVFWKF